MTIIHIREQLNAYTSWNTDEQASVNKTLDLIESTPKCFWRNCFPAHIIGDALVVNHEKTHVLLHKQKYYNTWYQFGGHCDGENDVFSVAKRELKEESGITDCIRHTDIFDVNISRIPHHPAKKESEHHHHNICYLAFVDKHITLSPQEGESTDIKRFEIKNREPSPGKYEMQRRKEKLLAMPT